MMKKLYVIMMCLLCGGHIFGQGINFIQGSLDDAFAQAQKEGKLVFVDFWAEWCGPCKQLAANVFTQKEVGDYYNEKFVCVQVDTEDPSNKAYVRKYKVQSLPTLMYIQADGKLISRSAGTMSVEDFIHAGKVAAGDAVSFEELYDKYKSSPKDLDVLQQLLEQAPAFVGIQEGMDKQKWVARVEELYAKYVKMKPVKEMVNKADFKIIRTFHKVTGEKDPMLEEMIDHLDEYIANVGNAPAAYLLEYNNKIISRLARAGKEEYKQYLERINGDLKAAYALMPLRNLSPYERMKNMYDGEYLIYYKKDASAYIDLKKKYLEALGENVNATDYGVVVQDLYTATNGKLSPEMHRQAIDWLIKALQFPDIPKMDQINLVTLLGDAHREVEEYEEAKKCYNQAFMEAMQLEQKMTQAAVQMKLKQRLARLELLAK